MSHPFNRDAQVSPGGPLDQRRGEPFLSSIFEAFDGGQNLSAFERNRVYLGEASGRFQCVTHLSGAGSTADCRSVAVGDYNNDGRPDLFVRGPGGQPLALYENQCQVAGHYLKLTLRGTSSNRLGLGARLRIKAGEQILTRWLDTPNTFASQAASEVIVGLGDRQRVDEITVDWPSGLVQRFEAASADQWLEIVEGQSMLNVVVPLRRK